MDLSSSELHNMRIEKSKETPKSVGSMAQIQSRRPHYYHVVCFDLIIKEHEKIKQSPLTEEEANDCQSCTNDELLQEYELNEYIEREIARKAQALRLAAMPQVLTFQSESDDQDGEDKTASIVTKRRKRSKRSHKKEEHSLQTIQLE